MLLVLPAFCVAQKKPHATDTVTKKDFFPTGIRVATDVIALIKTYDVESYKGWELNVDVDVYRYFLALDFGSWGRDFYAGPDHYTNTGTYFRAGVDVNFLPKDPDKNVLFLGIRYARGVFSEDFIVEVNDPVWGTFNEHYVNNDIPSRWFELTGGLKVKIWKMLWLGYTARFKFALHTGSTPDMLPSDVPGYGRVDKESIWGFNYQLLIRLPVRRVKH